MTAEARTDTERVPRLARDSWRAWLTTGIAFVPAVGASTAYTLNEFADGRRPDQVILTTISFLTVIALQFLIY